MAASAPSNDGDDGYELIIDARVAKRMERLPPKHKRQVWERIGDLASNPRPHDHKKLKGLAGFRIDVGEYRVLYEVDDAARTVDVYDMMHRNEGYGKVRRNL